MFDRARQSRTALICTAPGSAIVSLADAKAHLRVDFSDDDTLIQSLCAAASARLDGDSGELKRALCTQTWQLVLPRFAALGMPWRIELPLPPHQAVTGITYLDPSGNALTLDPSAWSFIACGTAASYLVPAFGTSWPGVRDVPDAVKITFTAGYGDAATDVPEPLVQAAKIMISDWYENRSSFSSGQIAELPFAVQALIWSYRILRL